MRILVTGATGFLGEEYALIAAKKHKLVAIYRNKPGRAIKNVDWVKADLTKKTDFANIVPKLKNKIQIIVHIGGSTPNRAYRDNSFAATTQGTKILVDFAKKIGVKKIIFISSISILIDKPGPYAMSKIVAEKIIRKSGLKYIIIRPGTIIGPRAVDFNRMVRLISRAPVLPVVNPTEAKVQPIEVHDLAELILKCSEISALDGREFYAVGTEVLPLNEFINTIASIYQHRVRVVAVPQNLAILVAKLAEMINPNWGLNEERVRIQTFDKVIRSKEMKFFKLNYQKFLDMIKYLDKVN